MLSGVAAARSAEDLQAENGAAGQALDRARDGLIAHREYPVICLDIKAAGAGAAPVGRDQEERRTPDKNVWLG